ncbi:MAG: RraA family protein [Elusimicrobia bacterium]|nr:RraA family protein [Elusimicrobiota bacterium]
MTAGADDHFDEELIGRCRRIGTATWSDALDSLGIDGVLRGLTVRSGNGRVAGEAVTVQEEVAPFGTFDLSHFDVGGIIEATSPGSIAVVAMDGADVSTFGGLSARAGAQRGIAGVVVDGGCRDVEEIRAAGIYLASCHVTPRSGKRRVKVVAIGEPVVCGGVRIAAGDCVIADETGVVAVPADRLREALAIAEALERNDRRFECELLRGAEFGAVASRLGHL